MPRTDMSRMAPDPFECPDAHHPSLVAQVELARAVMEELFRRREFGLGDGERRPPAIDPAACASHFNVDSRTWAGVLIRAAIYFSHLAAARYDPSERRAKQHRLMDAGEQV